MTKEQVFEVVKESILEILVDLTPKEIDIQNSLKNLGANSIDRMEIVVSSMEALELKIPLVEFGSIKNIEGLVNFLYEKKNY